MQKAYLLEMCDLAEKDANVLLCLADSGTGYDELFRKAYPKQLLDFGIAEENMVAAAAGMASCGFIPFVYTAGAFLAYRSMEFIRDDVCLQRMNVKIIGMGTGLAWSTLGPTHHTTEDIGLLRSLPGLTVLSPSTPVMASLAVREAYRHKGPVYIRVGMGGESELYETEPDWHIGQSITLKEGKDAAIFAVGTLVEDALKAAELLEERGVSASVIDVASIAPFDEAALLREAAAGKLLISAEEHNVTGGIGTAMADALIAHGTCAPLLKLGLDGFAKGYGTVQEVRRQNGLDAEGLADRIARWAKEVRA